MMDQMFTIYALIDPRDFSPFYVGCTRDPEARSQNHQMPSAWAKHGAKYGPKMQELRAAKLRPYFGILEVTADRSREEFHIREMARLGFPLVNKHKTGKRSKGYVRKGNLGWAARVRQRQATGDHALAAALARLKERRTKTASFYDVERHADARQTRGSRNSYCFLFAPVL
jgi:hypothetical protein